MKRILTLMFVAAMMLVLTTAAQAGTLTISGGTSGFIPGGAPASNTFLDGVFFPGLTTIQGYYGSQILYTVLGIGNVTIDYFGAEAGFHNQFLYAGVLPNAGFDHTAGLQKAVNNTTPISSASFALASGTSAILDFSYSVNGATAPTPGGGPKNGINPINTPGSQPNFFAACDPVQAAGPATATNCDTIWVFLDDNGAGDDDNHDDYLVRITVTDTPRDVPEPASFALIGSGLLGLGLIARRVRK